MAEIPNINPDQLRNALFGPKLTEEEKFEDFLNETEWANSHVEPIRAEYPPGYYVSMSKEERITHKVVIDFANAANFKKSPPAGLPPNLDTLSKCPEMGGLSIPETERLYKMPGVRVSLEKYVELFDSDRSLGERSDPKNPTYSLRTAKTRRELDVCRATIRREIRKDVLESFGPHAKNVNVDLESRKGEQAAFAFAYVGGLFESLDSSWDNSGRKREPACFNELVSVPIKLAMEPLDALVATFKKDISAVSPYGRLGEWGYGMALESNEGRPLSSIKNIKLIVDENKDKDHYWRVMDEGETIFIPECYPRDMIKSVFEETKIENVDLLSYLRSKEEIPWDRVGDTMWTDYSSKLSKAQTLTDVLQGKNLIRWGEFENVGLWIQDVSNALAKFGLRRADSVKRWMLYASAGINTRSREPKLRVSGRRLDILHDFGPKGGNYLPWDKLLFPWDGRSFFS